MEPSPYGPFNRKGSTYKVAGLLTSDSLEFVAWQQRDRSSVEPQREGVEANPKFRPPSP